MNAALGVRDRGSTKMSGPQLTKTQREDIFKPLFAEVIGVLEASSAGDPELLWALRRKLAKELTYLERGTPAHRGKLKAFMMKKQDGNCALCGEALPETGSELDRFKAFEGYSEQNVRLVHHECHIKDQAHKGYA